MFQHILPTPLQSERQLHPAVSFTLAKASEDADELFAHSLVKTEHLGERAVIRFLVRKAYSCLWYAKRPFGRVLNGTVAYVRPFVDCREYEDSGSRAREISSIDSPLIKVEW